MSQNQFFPGAWSQMPQPSIATSPVSACHSGIISPTSSTHVGDWLTTSTSHVEDLQLATASHAGGTSLVTTSHNALSSPTYAIHVGDFSPATASHVEGIHTIEKPRRVRCKPNFLYRIFKGDHLTCLCPTTAVVPEVWSSLRGPSGSESSLVSQHFVSPLIDATIMPMQSLPNTTPIF
jgi:hypothetical protein